VSAFLHGLAELIHGPLHDREQALAVFAKADLARHAVEQLERQLIFQAIDAMLLVIEETVS
jgi:hypothetical protein